MPSKPAARHPWRSPKPKALERRWRNCTRCRRHNVSSWKIVDGLVVCELCLEGTPNEKKGKDLL